MKAKSFIFALFAVAVCFYACESTSLDEQQDDSSATVLPDGEQNPDGDGDDGDEVVELPELPDLEDVDDVCTKMTDLDFMRYCYENFDVNGDAKVSMYEANVVKEITCNTAKDFTGIEYFPNLESFESYSAKILNLRYNTKLTDIKFYGKASSSYTSSESAPIEELDLRYCASLIEIGSDTFHGCTKLATIELPSNLTSIGGSAFYNCSGLTSIDFPVSLTSIGGSAFYKCTNLETVISRAVTPPSITSVNVISSDTFYGCSFSLYVPAESVDAYKDSGWTKYSKTIEAIDE